MLMWYFATNLTSRTRVAFYWKPVNFPLCKVLQNGWIYIHCRWQHGYISQPPSPPCHWIHYWHAVKPPPWTEWQTCVKTLPCPKLHLWVVIKCAVVQINVMASRVLSYWKNTWLRMMCCLQIIWRENRKSQQRLWSAAILCGEDVFQAGCD